MTEREAVSTERVAHTPGPWVVGWGGGVSGARAAAYVNLTESTIARLPVRIDGRPEVVIEVAEYGISKPSPQMEADARLIAAAPDLLSALKAVRDWMDNPELPICPLDIEKASAIRIAIAKAEGRNRG